MYERGIRMAVVQFDMQAAQKLANSYTNRHRKNLSNVTLSRIYLYCEQEVLATMQMPLSVENTRESITFKRNKVKTEEEREILDALFTKMSKLYA